MSAQLETKGHGLDSLAQLTEGLNLPHHEEAPATPAPAATDKPSGDVVNIGHHRKPKDQGRNPRPARQPENHRAPAPRAAESGQRPPRRERAIIVMDVFLAEDTNILLQAIRQCKENDCDAVVSLSLTLPGAEKSKLEFTLEIVGGDRILMRVLRGSQGLFGAMFSFEAGYILFRDEILRDVVEVPAKRKDATEGVAAIIQLIESHRNAVRARQEAQAKQD